MFTSKQGTTSVGAGGKSGLGSSASFLLAPRPVRLALTVIGKGALQNEE